MAKIFISIMLAILMLNPSASVTATSHITAEWTQLQTLEQPLTSAWGQLAYDPVNDLALFYGGTNGTLSDETWIYNPSTQVWSQVDSTVSPQPREYHSMVYVKSTEQFIMYGGFGIASIWFDTTWLFDVATMQWEELTTTGSPGGSVQGGMVYLSGTNTVLLYQGWTPGFQESSAMWEFHVANHTWLEVDTVGDSFVGAGRGMDYDPILDRVLFYGGINDGLRTNETLMYNHNDRTWIEVDVTDTPNSLMAGFTETKGLSMVHNPDVGLTFVNTGFYLFYFDNTTSNWIQANENLGTGGGFNIFGQFTYLESTKQFLQYGGYYDNHLAYEDTTFVAKISVDGVPILPREDVTGCGYSATCWQEDPENVTGGCGSGTATCWEEDPDIVSPISDTTQSPIRIWLTLWIVLFFPRFYRKHR